MEISPAELEKIRIISSQMPPRSAGKNKKGKFPNELWTFFGEEFRNLRTKILNAFKDEGHRILLVTSAVPMEGKTTVSINIARSFAVAGRKTLLIDGDLRRPDVHGLFGIERSLGLSDVVQAKGSLEDAVAATDLADLDVLTVGGHVETPAELINSQKFREVLQTIASRYDCVVLDSPPLISITDSIILAQYVDGILLVVKGNATPREIVKTALDQIHDRPVLGVVLNGISAPKRYGYYY